VVLTCGLEGASWFGEVWAGGGELMRWRGGVVLSGEVRAGGGELV
jgi:hypothetical protein